MQFVVIGTPGDRRVELLEETMSRLHLPAAKVVSYADLLTGKAHLAKVVQPDSIVRIESPGRDFAVEKLLLMAGADNAAVEPFEHISRHRVPWMQFNKGRIWFPRQWYLGFCHTLRLISSQLAECPPNRLMNDLPDIEVMFDKAGSHSLFTMHGLPVPQCPGQVDSYDALIDIMQRSRCYRVFIKLAHGSSASGAVAYQWDGERHRAITTVEITRENRQTHLYNSRRIRTSFDRSEIRRLIDALCRHNVHVEQWIPKAAHHNKVFDLRVVVINGEIRHTVVRLSNNPMTNLHLLNERAPIDILDGHLPSAAWTSAKQTCLKAAALFPGSLYCGVDLMFEPGYRRHHILEINAFGDLLPGSHDRGQSTYEAEICAMMERA